MRSRVLFLNPVSFDAIQLLATKDDIEVGVGTEQLDGVSGSQEQLSPRFHHGKGFIVGGEVPKEGDAVVEFASADLTGSFALDNVTHDRFF